MSATHDLYQRWLDELWNGAPEAAEDVVSPDFVGHWPDREVNGPAELAAMVDETQTMFAELTFTLELGPIVEGDLVSARWLGCGKTAQGPVSFVGHDILRVDRDRFVEYWPATVTGS